MTSCCSASSRSSALACDAGDDEALHRRLLELLATSANDLLQAEDLARTLDHLFDKIRNVVQLDIFFHYSFDPEAEALELVAWGGIDDAAILGFERLQLGEAICGRVAQRRQVLIGEHVRTSDDPAHALARTLDVDAFYGTPLLHKDRLLGTLVFGRKCCGTFSEAERRFLETLSSYVTLAKHRIGVDHELRTRLQERERMLAERVEIERQMIELSRASALGSIAATVAHELNQPLSAAVNYIAAIRLSPDTDPRVRELGAAAETQLQRAGEIIRRIRSMVRHDDRAQDVRSLGQAIEEAVSLVRAASPRLLPPIGIRISPDATHARFDNVQIVQVLANLLRNAGQACNGRPEARVTVTTDVHAPGEVVVRVIDNGPGVTADRRPMLFQPGLRDGRADGPGLGLGLAIAHHLIEGHGGRIWVEETPGGGATFDFTLPAARAEVQSAL